MLYSISSFYLWYSCCHLENFYSSMVISLVTFTVAKQCAGWLGPGVAVSKNSTPSSKGIAIFEHWPNISSIALSRSSDLQRCRMSLMCAVIGLCGQRCLRSENCRWGMRQPVSLEAVRHSSFALLQATHSAAALLLLRGRPCRDAFRTQRPHDTLSAFST